VASLRLWTGNSPQSLASDTNDLVVDLNGACFQVDRIPAHRDCFTDSNPSGKEPTCQIRKITPYGYFISFEPLQPRGALLDAETPDLRARLDA
jgi:hypothetical protein